MIARRAALLSLPALGGCGARGRNPLTRGIPAGDGVVAQAPALAAHGTMPNEPDLVLRWSAIPADARALRIVLHFHGFAAPGEALRLTQRVHGAGMVFGADPPTLAILVRGRPLPGRPGAFDWPAVAAQGGLAAVIRDGMAPFGPGLPAPSHLVLTAHSGGGAGLVVALEASAFGRVRVDEAHFHDALYRDPAPVLRWVSARVAAERAGAPPCALVVIAREGSGTTAPARRLAAGLTQAGLASPTRRVEFTTAPHGDIPRLFGPALLANPAAALPGTIAA